MILIMGNICSGNCESTEMKLSTPFGKCSCGRSVCGCFTKKDDESEDNVVMAQIKEIMKAKMAHVETMLQTQIIQSLNKYGDVAPIHILQHGQASPISPRRAMTIRIKESEPYVQEVVEPYVQEVVEMKVIVDDAPVADHPD